MGLGVVTPVEPQVLEVAADGALRPLWGADGHLGAPTPEGGEASVGQRLVRALWGGEQKRVGELLLSALVTGLGGGRAPWGLTPPQSGEGRGPEASCHGGGGPAALAPSPAMPLTRSRWSSGPISAP